MIEDLLRELIAEVRALRRELAASRAQAQPIVLGPMPNDVPPSWNPPVYITPTAPVPSWPPFRVTCEVPSAAGGPPAVGAANPAPIVGWTDHANACAPQFLYGTYTFRTGGET